MWSVVADLFWEYMGTGLIMILYLISLIYLWVKEKRKYIRIMLIYVPVILLFLYFNPLFAGLLYKQLGNEIYYRILWLLPVAVTIAFAVTTLYSGLPDKGRTVFALAAVFGVVISGSYIYSNPYFQKAENFYHMPDSVVHICDAIIVPGREVMAAFPLEMVQYVRQYEPTVCMPYGREMTVDRWGLWDAFPNEMEKEIIDLSCLAPLAKERGCHYIILSEDKEVIGNPAEYGWEVFGRTDGYVIYRDMDFGLEIGSGPAEKREGAV